MKKIVATLEIVDDLVVVRHPVIHHDKPEVTYLHWPTTERAEEVRKLYPHWIGSELESHGVGYPKYSIRLGSGCWSGWHTISLRDGSKTESIKNEVEQIPPPKTKFEVRWDRFHKRWEKRLKKGWVIA